MPPMATSSDMRCLPLGFKSASTGTCLPILVKSSSAELHAGGIRHGQQMQHRVGRTAQRDDHRDGIFKRLARHDVAAVGCRAGAGRPPPRRPCRQSFFFALDTAACAELFGRLMPRASMALAMVLAVYIPPQEPGPGIAQDSICLQLARRRFSYWHARRPPRRRRQCPACASRR